MDNGSGGKNLLPFLRFAVCDLRLIMHYALCINNLIIVLHRVIASSCYRDKFLLYFITYKLKFLYLCRLKLSVNQMFFNQ